MVARLKELLAFVISKSGLPELALVTIYPLYQQYPDNSWACVSDILFVETMIEEGGEVNILMLMIYHQPKSSIY